MLSTLPERGQPPRLAACLGVLAYQLSSKDCLLSTHPGHSPSWHSNIPILGFRHFLCFLVGLDACPQAYPGVTAPYVKLMVLTRAVFALKPFMHVHLA